jgi:hypothetical protein
VGCRQAKSKKWLHQQVEGSCIGNKCGVDTKLYTDSRYFKEFELQELMPTTEQLKYVYTSRIKVEDPKDEELIPQKTFWEIYDEFTEENGKLNDWTKATFEKFAAQRNHLHDFNSNISFDDFTEDGLNDYIDFLCHQLEMRNSTISKQVGFLKWFLRWSLKKGYHQNAAFETYSM